MNKQKKMYREIAMKNKQIQAKKKKKKKKKKTVKANYEDDNNQEEANRMLARNRRGRWH
jgi:hypothetical protein